MRCYTGGGVHVRADSTKQDGTVQCSRSKKTEDGGTGGRARGTHERDEHGEDER